MSDERIRIREHTIEDLEPYCEWQCDPEVGRHVSWLPRTRPEAEASLRDAIAQQDATPRVRYFFAVVHVESGEMVGDVGFTLRSPSVADCGWFLRKRFWGNGYGPAAVRSMLSYARGIPGIEEFAASCSSQNAASTRVMEKCGFSLIRASDQRRWYTRR